MKSQNKKVENIDRVVVLFAGDSGDGMQLTGSRFTETSVIAGDDLSTLPDYPAEIRAPAGSLYGVSGFQIQFGKDPIFTPGDNPDVLVAMNPAALKANSKNLKLNAKIIVNQDAFTEKNLQLANYDTNPLEDNSLDGFQLFAIPITTLTRNALEGIELTQKEKDRCKNFFALGIMFWMYSRSIEPTKKWIEKKFSKYHNLAEANIKALTAGYNFADTTEIFTSHYVISEKEKKKGNYRNISGNEAVSLGLISAAQKAGLGLFLGSYPITPASDILHTLSKHKNFNIKTFQAEDEIAAAASTIGAAFAGSLAVTSTSGPGLALKSEALGLAVITELPLIIVDVQRAGPSTGLPTKTEQADLFQSMYGRSGEAPLPVIAAKSPSDAFDSAYEAAAISLKFRTPVILLSDGYLGNGSEPWEIPDVSKLPEIDVNFTVDKEGFAPYKRDPDTLARMWAVPGTPGLEHRIGGLEREDITGEVSYDPDNHNKMVQLRAEKVQRIKNYVTDPQIFGEPSGDLLVVSWGSTFGAVHSAVEDLIDQGNKVSHYHLRWINPLPKNLKDFIHNFEHILVPEINTGQLSRIIRSEFLVDAKGYNILRGLPLQINSITEVINNILEG